MPPKPKTKDCLGWYQWYRRRWYHPEIGPEVRKTYNGDHGAFYHARLHQLRWTDIEIMTFLEEGMKCFAELERRLLRRSRWRAHVNPYKNAGKALFDAFLDVLSTEDRKLTPETDFVFAAIDFEGDESRVGGIHGYGVATLDTRDILTRHEEAQVNIKAENFRLAKHNQGFLFGDTKRIEIEDLRDTIIRSLTMDVPNQSPRKVVLVGHGIEADLRSLQYLKVDLQKDLPHVIGFVDTSTMGWQYLGKQPSLRNLLLWLRIPHRHDFLHCSGNDAVFTMQALLALSYRQSKFISSAWPALDLYQLAYREHPVPVKEKNVEQDWEIHLMEDGLMTIEAWA